jgi:para-nitrobenzyl esterase
MLPNTTRRTLILGGLTAGAIAAAPALAGTAAPIVETASGKVRGRASGGVASFLGIPYGADTSGANRFLPPRPARPWAGVRDCLALGHQSPQLDPSTLQPPGTDLSSPFVQRVLAATKQGMEEGNEGEDCLVLNLWTADASPARKRPVMVWLHGGGFAIGSAGDPQYDGAALVRRGDVVVVGVNHRLNAFGYLYLGDLDPAFADSGNAGQLDLIAALQWVRDNVAQFGGDPGNVTLFGESGGGAKVSTLLATPAARGLFHRAIIQSGPSLTGVPRDTAAAHAERTLANLGLGKGDLARLQQVPAPALIAAAAKAQIQAGRAGGRLLAPVVDGRSLPRDPYTPDAPPSAAGVPVMIGSTRDEAALFMVADPQFGKLDEAQVRARARGMAGDKGDALIDAIRAARPDYTPFYWLPALATAQGTWIHSIHLAERQAATGAAVYMYRLDWTAPFDGGVLKSPHGLDTPLVFDNAESRPLINGTGPEPRRLAAAMSTAWIAFARGQAPWPAYDPARRETMIFDVRSHVVADPDQKVRQLLEA